VLSMSEGEAVTEGAASDAVYKGGNGSETSNAEKPTQNNANEGESSSQRPMISTSPPPLEATAGLTKLQNSPVFPPRMAATSSAAAVAAAAALGPLSPLTTVASVPHQFGNGTPTMISLSTPVFMAMANASPRIQSLDVNSSPRTSVLDSRLSTSALIGSPSTSAFSPLQTNLTGSPVLSSTTNHAFVTQSPLQTSRNILGSQGYPPIHAFADEPSMRGRKLPASNLSNPLYFSTGSGVSSPVLPGLIDTPPQQPQSVQLSAAQQQILSPLTEVNSPLATPAEPERKARSTPVKTPKSGKASTPGRRKSSKGAQANSMQGMMALANVGPQTPSTPREKKRRGRPPTDKPAACSHCGATSTPEWRRGKIAEGVYVPLCNACGLQLAKRNRMQRTSVGQDSLGTTAPPVPQPQQSQAAEQLTSGVIGLNTDVKPSLSTLLMSNSATATMKK